MIRLKNNTAGFTILELMIATVVFGVVLLIASAAIIGLSRQYYKGITQSKVQEAARNTVEEIANNIKYDTGGYINMAPGSPVGALCIADRQYTYVLNSQLGDDVSSNQSKSVLNRKDGCDVSSIPSLSTFNGNYGAAGTELIGQNMRLTKFSVSTDSTGNLTTILVRVLYGADDQVCALNIPGDCESDTTSPYARLPDVVCKPQAGSQFCGFAEYRAIVTKRL